ncbi:universal stress protein [Ramlibacter henchirensis]|nr:universal stress protein [Ramlibacter henchirensis]
MIDREARTSLFVVGKARPVAPALSVHYWNLEGAIRVLRRPILRASRTFRAPLRFAVGFDGTPFGRRLLETVSNSALLAGLACRVMVAGRAKAAACNQLRWAELTLRDAGFQVAGQLLPDDSEAAICACIDEADIDLLVLAMPWEWGVKEFFLGSTLSLIRTCPVPVLIYPHSPVLLGRRHMP